MNYDNERALDWEDEVEREGSEWTLLPDGDYDFDVIKVERSRYAGGDKIPPCPMAIVHMEIRSDEGRIPIKQNFILHTKMEWKICEFFTGIGLRKHGERFAMKWGAAAGTHGRCQLGTREWPDSKGETRKSNDIKKFYDPQETASQNVVPAKGFQPGEF